MTLSAGQAAEVSVRDLIEAGAHFGHPTAKWNPKMKPYIHDSRNGVYIINLQKTASCFREALDAVRRIAATGQKILFIGTKKQAQEVVKSEAARAGQFYVTERWVGGTLTNFHTIKRSINMMKTLQKMAEEKSYGTRKKKEILGLEKRRGRLEINLTGIKDMVELPGAIFVIDPHREYIAVNEAKALNVPIIAVVDTNCDPDGINYPIPGNDDSIRAIKLYASKVADAILAGGQIREENLKRSGGTQTEAKESSNKSKGFRPQVISIKDDGEVSPGDSQT
jgi:small subunit ribosomal protein S2